ncbi:hypothetical protein VKT23_019407 [Stygiomarasmius scandens]|uniref:Uncharacterized protein n=1 Tax=Marasmiellus scandens TaxID=2682957 RepID=A0ABR1IQE0_9AGAR
MSGTPLQLYKSPKGNMLGKRTYVFDIFYQFSTDSKTQEESRRSKELIDSYKEQLKNFEEDLAKSHSEKSEAEAQLQTLRVEFNAIKDRSQQEESRDLASLRNERNSLETSLDTAKRDLQTQRAKHRRQTQSSLLGKDIMIDRLERRLGEAQQCNGTLQADKEALGVQLDHLRAAAQKQSRLSETLQKDKEDEDVLARTRAEVEKLMKLNAEKTAEVDSIRLQLEQLQATSATSSTSRPDWFTSVRGLGRSLRSVDVDRELHAIRQQEIGERQSRRRTYQIGEEIETPDLPRNSGNSKFQKSYKPSRFTKAGRDMCGHEPDDDEDADIEDEGENFNRRKGKQRQQDLDSDQEQSSSEGSSEESEGERDENDEEKDDFAVRMRYKRKGVRTKWTPDEQRININRLARSLLLYCLNAQHCYEIFARDGVSMERLTQFEEDPELYGPKLRNSRLDKRGLTTRKILNNDWNQALISKLSGEAEYIVDKCKDNRFGQQKINWPALFEERL